MGIWSRYIACSHPTLLIDIGKIPSEFNYLLDRHASDFRRNQSQDEDEFELEFILSHIDDTSKIYGYLTPEYLRKWELTFQYLELLVKSDSDQPPDPLWILFYCTDEQLVYSLMWDELNRKVIVNTGPSLTRK